MSTDRCKHGVEMSAICDQCDDERAEQGECSFAAPAGSVRIAALSAALQDCINLFNDADARPDHKSLVCTKERREMWQHMLTTHGSPNEKS